MSNVQRQAHLNAKKAFKPLFILGSVLCFFALTALTQSVAQAQTLYRIVGPDGRITFSDKPPTAPAKVTPLRADGKETGSANTGLPYELQQVVSRYPVTLFAGKDCAPCDAGRALLRSRGIPFTEKTITTNEDAESLKRLADTTSLPLLTIGGQQIKGYSSPEWTQYLNAAGYPEKSKLPASYRYTAPSPLVAVKEPEAPAKPGASNPAPAAVEAQPRINQNNPAGIVF